jgi:hypothetical protein
MTRVTVPPIPLTVCLLLTGCGVIQSLTSRSFDQRLSCAYGRQTSVLHFTQGARASDHIMAEDEAHLRALAQTAKGILDSASVADARGDVDRAERRLELALGVLDQAQLFFALPTRTTRACRAAYPLMD